MPRLKTPRLVMGTRIAVASELGQPRFEAKMRKMDFVHIFYHQIIFFRHVFEFNIILAFI